MHIITSLNSAQGSKEYQTDKTNGIIYDTQLQYMYGVLLNSPRKSTL